MNMLSLSTLLLYSFSLIIVANINFHLYHDLGGRNNNWKLLFATYFYSQYNRIATRRGKNRAAVAVAHSMLIIIYNMVKNKSHYRELGPDYFDNLNSQTKVDRLKKKLESLGYSVAKQEIPA